MSNISELKKTAVFIREHGGDLSMSTNFLTLAYSSALRLGAETEQLEVAAELLNNIIHLHHISGELEKPALLTWGINLANEVLAIPADDRWEDRAAIHMRLGQLHMLNGEARLGLNQLVLALKELEEKQKYTTEDVGSLNRLKAECLYHTADCLRTLDWDMEWPAVMEYTMEALELLKTLKPSEILPAYKRTLLVGVYERLTIYSWNLRKISLAENELGVYLSYVLDACLYGLKAGWHIVCLSLIHGQHLRIKQVLAKIGLV